MHYYLWTVIVDIHHIAKYEICTNILYIWVIKYIE